MISGKLFLKRQLASMYSESASSAPASEESSGTGTTRKYVSDGQSFWSTDPVGLGPDQDTFESLSRDEQNVCEWLQTFTRDIFLFHVDRILSPSFVSNLRTELRSSRLRSSGAQAIKTPHHTHAKTLTISHVFKFLSRDLRDDSPEVTLETIFSIVRPEGSELGRWLDGFLSLSADVDACKDTALSKKTLFFYFAGQVSRSEIKGLPADARWPTTEEEKSAFRLSSLVPHVEKAASSLPPFHTSEVREHTRELLVDPHFVRSTGAASPSRPKTQKGLPSFSREIVALLKRPDVRKLLASVAAREAGGGARGYG